MANDIPDRLAVGDPITAEQLNLVPAWFTKHMPVPTPDVKPLYLPGGMGWEFTDAAKQKMGRSPGVAVSHPWALVVVAQASAAEDPLLQVVNASIVMSGAGPTLPINDVELQAALNLEEPELCFYLEGIVTAAGAVTLTLKQAPTWWEGYPVMHRINRDDEENPYQDRLWCPIAQTVAAVPANTVYRRLVGAVWVKQHVTAGLELVSRCIEGDTVLVPQPGFWWVS